MTNSPTAFATVRAAFAAVLSMSDAAIEGLQYEVEAAFDPRNALDLPADGSGHCTESTTDASQASGTPNNPSNQTKGGE